MTDEQRAELADVLREVFAEQAPALPENHDEHHRFLADLIAFMEGTKKTAWEVILKSFVTFMIGLFALGFYLFVHK